MVDTKKRYDNAPTMAPMARHTDEENPPTRLSPCTILSDDGGALRTAEPNVVGKVTEDQKNIQSRGKDMITILLCLLYKSSSGSSVSLHFLRNVFRFPEPPVAVVILFF